VFISFWRYLVSIQQHKHQLQIKDLEKAKIEEVNQMKLGFFTNISHEFRAPLTLILGPLQKLIAESESTESIRSQLKLIYRNASRLLRLINELMYFRKIETGNMQVKAAKGEIVGFLKEIYLAFKELADRHCIEYQFETSIDSLETWFDRDHMDKIFYNLLSNAFKFTPDNGKIILKLEVTDNPESETSAFLRASITDSGTGISPEKLQHIFDRFYQLSTPASPGRKMENYGSGIGLALTRDLIELHKGKITVKSEPGSGSTFTVILPLGKEHYTKDQIVLSDHPVELSIEELDTGKNIPDDETESYTEKRKEIMIVDDDPDLRNFVTKTLESRYKVIQAAEGEEALKMAQESMPDCIITDILMPGMDGVEFCSRIKENPLTSHIPVIMLTAKTSDESKIEGFKTGADDYMPKPFNPVVLCARIKNLLEIRWKLQEKFRKDLILEPSEVTVTSMDEKFLRKAMEVVEKYIDDSTFDVRIFVNEMGMSRSALYRKLEALTGQSVNEFMRIIRLKRAAQLLSQNKMHISEISYEVGFNDPQYFSKCFSRQFGMTPSQYAAQSAGKSTV
jgi:CheY-like chemotaxis protein/AraC-like DNA-binding protein